MELGETMADNLVAKGVTASASDGLTTLAGKILDIQTGGRCYHIELDNSAYTTTGSLTVTATLQNQYQPYANQTVTFTGGTSTVTATTDSNGVATATVTFSASGTLTASYSNVSDTATVTVDTYLFYDACDSSAGLSNYGSSISIWKTNTATANISYDSTENAYLLKGSGNYNAIIPITAASNLDNYVMTFKAKHKTNSAYSQPSYFNYDTTATRQPTSYGVRYLGDGRIMCDTFTSTNDTTTNSVSGKTSGIASEYFLYTITKQGTSLHFEIERANSTNIYNKTMSVANNYKGIAFGLATESGESNSSYYIKEIKIEAL